MSGQDCFVSSPLPYPKTIPLTMITGSPRRMSRETQAGERVGWVASPSTLNAATPPSFAGRRVHGRRFVLRVDRAPERSEHPARTVRFLPGRERAPASHVLKVHFLVAEERRLVQRRLVIGAARRLRIEQVDAALLARRGNQLAALVQRTSPACCSDRGRVCGASPSSAACSSP